MDIHIVTTIISGVFALVGTCLSYHLSTSKAQKKLNEVKAEFNSRLSKREYFASKYTDEEFARLEKLNTICGDIYSQMADIIPDRESAFVRNQNKEPDMVLLSQKLNELDVELNRGRMYFPNNVMNAFDVLLGKGERFFTAAQTYLDAPDEDKEEHEKRSELIDKAYQERVNFKKNYRKVSDIVKKYLTEKQGETLTTG